MITVLEKSRKIRLPKYDYFLDKFDKLDFYFQNLTPKFEGNWTIILNDPKLDVIDSLLAKAIPDFIDCVIYVSNAKLNTIVLSYPSLTPKEVRVKDTLNDLIKDLHNTIDKAAVWAVYDVIGNNAEELEKAFTKLDSECTTGKITLRQIQKTYNYTKRYYASQVMLEFLTKSRYRWQHFDKLLHELGDNYAYYALKKQIVQILKDKNSYLQNKDVKGRIVREVDAPFICYVYTLFMNNTNPKNLYSIMYQIDNRNIDNLREIFNVNL